MFLKEILGLTPLPYRWIDRDKCIFEFNNVQFGIFVDFQELHLRCSSRILNISNVSFGILTAEHFKDSTNLDTSLTGFGHARTVFSTVADACVKNNELVNSDIICLAGSDEDKKRRALMYSIALGEIKSSIRGFNNMVVITATSSNGTILSMLSKIEFSDEEKKEITDILLISK